MARATFAGLTLAGFWLRADGLAGQALWSDEDITLDRARMPVAAMLESLPVEQAPLYYVLMRPWTILAGQSDYALRMPSALAGTLAIALAAFVGARLFGRLAGAAGALLVAAQLFAISYGQEARMYALLLALCLAAPAAVLRAEAREARGRPARRWWIGAGILAALAALTHHYGALIAFVLAAWAAHALVWAPRTSGPGVGRELGREAGVGPELGREAAGGPEPGRAAIVRRWWPVFAVAGLLYLPWLPRALRIGDFPGWRETTAGAAIRSILGAWLGGSSIASDPVSGAAAAGAIGALEPGAGPAAIALLGVPLALAAAGALWALASVVSLYVRSSPPRRRRAMEAEAAARLLAWLAVPAAVVGVLLWRSPDIHPRYLMPLHAAVWLAAGAGVSVLVRRLPRRLEAAASAILVVALVAASGAPLAAYRSGEERQKQGYRDLLAEVDRHASGRDTVLLLDGPAFGLADRYRDPDSPVKIENLHSSTNSARDAAGFEARLAELVDRRPTVWLASDGASRRLADAWLAAHLYPVSTAGFQDITLSRYFSPPEPLAQALEPEWIGRRCVDAAGRPLAPGAYALDSEDGPDPDAPRLPHLAIPQSAAVCLETATDTRIEAAPGAVVPIRLEWQPGAAWPESAPATVEHRISVRLLDRGASIVASADRRPADWSRPTTGWTPGEFVDDRHGLLVPTETPAGLHRIEIVFYDEHSLEPFATWSLPPTVEIDHGAGLGMDADEQAGRLDPGARGGRVERAGEAKAHIAGRAAGAKGVAPPGAGGRAESGA